MNFAYPLMLDVRDRLIVIIGGGAVAARKAAGLLEAGATQITVIAPEFRAAFPPTVQTRQKSYESSDVQGATLVFAATDRPQINSAVVADAKSRGILACRADSCDENAGDFITPARFTEGEVTVTVSSSNPALSVAIRNGLAQRFDLRWARMSHAMQALRPKILGDQSLTGQQRSALFRDLATEEAMQVLTTGGDDALGQWVAIKMEKLKAVAK